MAIRPRTAEDLPETARLLESLARTADLKPGTPAPGGKGPRISVITATYNQAPFLEGAVRSVLGQDFQDWEHIVVDDGSTDDTPAVLARLDPARLRVLRTANQGQPAALNAGLAMARGELVAFLDSDDEYCPRHLSLMLEVLGARDFALGRYQVVNCSPEPRPVIADFYHPGRTIDLAEVECGTGLMFGRREAFLGVGGFRPVRFSDTDLFNRMKAAGCSWIRAAEPSYRYFFGRIPDNMAVRETREDRLLAGRIHAS
jgi:glycosyltransferase involved in cell wall biosynthesis